MKALLSVLTLVLAVSVSAQAQVSLNDLMTNSVVTHEKLQGLRDFRVVIPGVLYRGGNSGGGQIPLKEVGLKALADKGFSASVYMYPYAWNQAPQNKYGVDYTNFGPNIKDRAAIKSFLTKVKDIIENKKGPMYVHCWNGWHASGEMAAYALMQFCGMNGEQAQEYWFANVPNGRVLRIKSFKIFDDLRISAEDSARICPR